MKREEQTDNKGERRIIGIKYTEQTQTNLNNETKIPLSKRENNEREKKMLSEQRQVFIAQTG